MSIINVPCVDLIAWHIIFSSDILFLCRFIELCARVLMIECFYEDLHRDDKMTVTFLSGPGTEGNHDIEFWVDTFFCLKDIC